MKLIGKIAQAWKEWRRKRRWNARLQLEHLRLQVMEDQCWMAHDPKVSALCQRYFAMLADDWEKRSVRNVSDFRREIGCDPWIQGVRGSRNPYDDLVAWYSKVEEGQCTPVDVRAAVERLAQYQVAEDIGRRLGRP